MNVIKFLNQYSVEKLKEIFSIKVNDYPDHNLMVLNYSTYLSPKYNNITKECRSLVLENKKPYNIISRSFSRFFDYYDNYGENSSIDLCSPNVRVYEKVDGSLINLYYHNGKWLVRTRSMALAEGDAYPAIGINVQNGHTFRGIFDSIITNNYASVDDFYKNLNTKNTYIFELVSPKTRIVKQYNKDDIYLLASIDNETGKEMSPVDLQILADILFISRPYTINFKSIKELSDYTENKLNDEDEGFVVADFTNLYNVKRYKFKAKKYLWLHRMMSRHSLTNKDITDIVMRGDEEEFLKYFPEYTSNFEPFLQAREKIFDDIKKLSDKYLYIKDRKILAEKIKTTKIQHILFGLYDNRDIDTILSNMTLNAKVKLLLSYM
jgi:hypothetical protein